MPQRGIGLQPRVAGSATLGKKAILFSTATRLRKLCAFLSKKTTQPRVRLKFFFLLVPRVDRSGNPGLEAVAPLGH